MFKITLGIVKSDHYRYCNGGVARHEEAMIHTDNRDNDGGDYIGDRFVVYFDDIVAPESSVEASPWMLNGE